MGTQAANRLVFSKSGLLPMEEMLEVEQKYKKLVIGIPKENHEVEGRVPLTPEAVEILVSQGHEIILESSAGHSANYSDRDYSEKGALLIKDRNSVFQADIVLKIAPPTLEEIQALRGQQILFSSLGITHYDANYVKSLMAKKVTAFAFENIKDSDGYYPVVRSMNAISGSTSILIAAEYLSNARGGKGVLLGGIAGITPTEVVVVGAGTAAEYAIRAAHGLGAVVKVFDSSIQSLIQLQNVLGKQLQTSVFHPQVLAKALKSADVLIGARETFENNVMFYVTDEMVRGMKKGSVIVDLSLMYGGCIESSEYRNLSDPVYTKFGVIHYAIPNLAARVSRTSSIALSNIFLPILSQIAQTGGINEQLKTDIGLRHGVYIFNGILTNRHIARQLDIPSSDIDLLMAAF